MGRLGLKRPFRKYPRLSAIIATGRPFPWHVAQGTRFQQIARQHRADMAEQPDHDKRQPAP
jgi:hypothetical protein